MQERHRRTCATPSLPDRTSCDVNSRDKPPSGEHTEPEKRQGSRAEGVARGHGLEPERLVSRAPPALSDVEDLGLPIRGLEGNASELTNNYNDISQAFHRLSSSGSKFHPVPALRRARGGPVCGCPVNRTGRVTHPHGEQAPGWGDPCPRSSETPTENMNHGMQLLLYDQRIKRDPGIQRKEPDVCTGAAGERFREVACGLACASEFTSSKGEENPGEKRRHGPKHTRRKIRRRRCWW